MFIDILKEIIYENGFVYSTMLIIMFASFLGAILMCSLKFFEIIKNSYYSSIFKKDVWNRTIDKITHDALLIKESSVVASLFLLGLKTYSKYCKDSEIKRGSAIEITKSTLEINLAKEISYLTQGFNLLSFNAVFLPYASILLCLWSIIDIFNTVDIGVLTLSMFVKPLFVITLGMMMAGISAIVYIVGTNKIEGLKEESDLFIKEITNKLHKNIEGL